MPAMPATDEAGRLAVLRARLASPMPDDRPWGWLGPLLVTAFGTFLRFNRLRVPRALVFDETYYVKDAWSILNHGVELNLVSNANTIIQAGHANIFAPCNGTSACGEYVVQPEMGKLLIAAGEWMFGLNSFGWRFASALFGSLAILLMCRIARRMTRSTLLGCVAGLLMSLDGLEFVLSRTGILDIFLMFFVLAAFGCIVIDRDISRAALAEGVARRVGGPAGPRLGIRRWRVAAGIFLGLAVATKWDAAWYIVGFAALGTAWDIGARRAAGLASFVRGALRETLWLPVTFVVIPLAVYLASWSGWFATGTGYDRDYAQQHGVNIPVISPLYSLFEYHLQAIGFGVGLKTPPPVPVAAVGLAAGHPAGRVLLRVLHRPGGRPGALLPDRVTPGRSGRRRCWRSGPRRSGGGRWWRCCSAWAGGCCTGTGGPARCCAASSRAGRRGSRW